LISGSIRLQKNKDWPPETSMSEVLVLMPHEKSSIRAKSPEL